MPENLWNMSDPHLDPMKKSTNITKLAIVPLIYQLVIELPSANVKGFGQRTPYHPLEIV